MSITSLSRRAATTDEDTNVDETTDDRFAAADKAASERARRLRLQRRLRVWAGRAVFLVIVLGGWQLCTAGSNPLVDPFFYSRPTDILHETIDLFRHGTTFGSFWFDIYTTMREAVYGFAIGTLGGVVLGVLLGQIRFLSEVLGPFIKMVNAIPRIVLAGIFTIALGVGMTSKVALAAVLVFFVVFFNAFQGVREVDPNVVANARVLGARPLQIVRHVTLPSALTWITASLHTAFGFAIVGAIVGEVVGAQRGLGLIVKQEANLFNPAAVWSCMLVIMLCVLLAEFLMGLVEKRLLSWRPPSRADSAGL